MTWCYKGALLAFWSIYFGNFCLWRIFARKLRILGRGLESQSALLVSPRKSLEDFGVEEISLIVELINSRIGIHET